MNKAQLRSFLRGSVVSMVGVGTLGIMNYFVRRTLALNLPEEDFGFFYGALALLMFVLVFISLGIAQSTTILIAKSFAENNLPKSKKIFTLTFIIKAILGAIAFAVMEALAPYLQHSYFGYSGSPILLMLLFLLIPVQALESTFLSVLTACKAFTTHKLLMNIKTFVILLGVYFFAKKYGVKSCIFCFIAASAVITVLALLAVRRYGIWLIPLSNIQMSDVKDFFSISSYIALSTAGISAMYYMDTICLTWLTDLKAVAMYNIALPIMQIAQSFFVFPLIFTPFVSEMWQNKDYPGIRRACYMGSLLMFATLPIFILGGSYFAADIIRILFAAKYVAAAPAVTILWCGMVFFSIASFNISALNSGNRQKTAAWMIAACVLVNFLLNVILIPPFGYVGAALATAITYVVMALTSVIILMTIFHRKISE